MSTNEEDKDKYKELNLNPKTVENIAVTPVVKDGKMLYDKNNKNHRYIVEDD